MLDERGIAFGAKLIPTDLAPINFTTKLIGDVVKVQYLVKSSRVAAE